MVKLIRPLYDIERALRESKAPPEEVKEKREELSRPIVEEFFKELTKRNRDTQNPPRNKYLFHGEGMQAHRNRFLSLAHGSTAEAADLPGFRRISELTSRNAAP